MVKASAPGAGSPQRLRPRWPQPRGRRRTRSTASSPRAAPDMSWRGPRRRPCRGPVFRCSLRPISGVRGPHQRPSACGIQSHVLPNKCSCLHLSKLMLAVGRLPTLMPWHIWQIRHFIIAERLAETTCHFAQCLPAGLHLSLCVCWSQNGALSLPLHFSYLRASPRTLVSPSHPTRAMGRVGRFVRETGNGS